MVVDHVTDVVVNNCFDILGIAPEFDIDLGALNNRYIKLQMQSHPDMTGNDSDSSKINFAYNLLMDPIRRAEHLSAVLGYEYKQTNGCPGELFEIQEKLYGCSEEERGVIVSDLSQRLAEIYTNIGRLFKQELNNEIANAIFKQLDTAKYIKKMIS